MVKEVYLEQKMMRRNLQRLANLLLFFIFLKIGREAAASGNETGKIICRIGMLLNAAAHFLMAAVDISDLVKLKKENKEKNC